MEPMPVLRLKAATVAAAVVVAVVVIPAV